MNFSTLPPYSNRGAENTYGSGLIACVDWLQATFKSDTIIQEVLSFFNLENSTFLDIGGQYGYKNGITSNGIFFYFNGNDGMGTHLQITGTGCRYLEHIKEDFSWIKFFAFIDSYDEYNITRLDIALDDFRDKMSIAMLRKKIKKGECISLFRDSKHIETINIADGESKGETLYFGNPSSRLQIRFYEKNLEMLNKGIEHDINSWNRYELQLRKDRAETMFNILLHKHDDDFSSEVKGILSKYIRFANKDNNLNRSRWKTYKPWKDFINEVDKIKLTKNPTEKDLLDTLTHIKKQYGPTLAMLHNADIDLNKLAQEEHGRMRDKHLKKLSDYKKESHREMGNWEK